MPHVQEAIDLVRKASDDIGIAELARRAGVTEDTARLLLRRTPKSVQILLDLEIQAEKHAEEQRARYAEPAS